MFELPMTNLISSLAHLLALPPVVAWIMLCNVRLWCLQTLMTNPRYYLKVWILTLF